VSLFHSLLLRLYEALTREDAVQTADMIFVFAGRMERKEYGLELFRSGMSECLVLSVGRFEVRKMRNLDLEGSDELMAMRDQTPPARRHFFVKVDAAGVRIERAELQNGGTYWEALALRKLLEQKKARRVIVVSTDVHLRRVSLSLAKVCRGLAVEFFYCPVPSRLGFFKKESWWIRRDDRRFVLHEAMKLAAYYVILSLPAKLAYSIMQLNHD